MMGYNWSHISVTDKTRTIETVTPNNDVIFKPDLTIVFPTGDVESLITSRSTFVSEIESIES